MTTSRTMIDAQNICWFQLQQQRRYAENTLVQLVTFKEDEGAFPGRCPNSGSTSVPNSPALTFDRFSASIERPQLTFTVTSVVHNQRAPSLKNVLQLCRHCLLSDQKKTRKPTWAVTLWWLDGFSKAFPAERHKLDFSIDSKTSSSPSTSCVSNTGANQPNFVWKIPTLCACQEQQ